MRKFGSRSVPAVKGRSASCHDSTTLASIVLKNILAFAPLTIFFLFLKDRFLPIANIARIMKLTLPENAKIAKDSKETLQECVSEFISFITSEASDKCMQEKRKTINGDDLLWAMSTLGFDKYVEPLKIYLAKYREAVRGEKPDKKSAAYKQQDHSTL